jgi:hypothetical protein
MVLMEPAFVDAYGSACKRPYIEYPSKTASLRSVTVTNKKRHKVTIGRYMFDHSDEFQIGERHSKDA